MLEKCQDRYTDLVDLIEKKQNELNFQSQLAQLNLGKLLTTSLKIHRLKVINSSTEIPDKKLRKSLAKKLTEKFEALLSLLNCKSNLSKAQIMEVVITGAFDRYLIRQWLYTFLQHQGAMQRHLYANKGANEFALLQAMSYLGFLVADVDTHELLVNDEFENMFFDKLYQSLAEKHSLFEAASEALVS